LPILPTMPFCLSFDVIISLCYTAVLPWTQSWYALSSTLFW
jgi:hypothetical protein